MSSGVTSRIRWLVLLSMLAVVGGTLASYLSRKRDGGRERPLPPHIAADVDQQTQGFSLSKTLGDHPLYTVHAARVTNLKESGKAILHGVSIVLYGKQGDRLDRITTPECEFDPATGSLLIPGAVEMEFDLPLSPSGSGVREGDSTPIFIVTSGLSFDQNTGIAATEKRVRFRFTQGEGTSQGAVYNPQDELLILKADVRITVENSSGKANGPASGSLPGGAGTLHLAGGMQPLDGPWTHVRAGSLRFFRGQQGEVFLGAPVEITQGTRKIQAGDSEIVLDAENRAKRALLGGGVVGSEQTPRYSVEARAKRAAMEFTARGQVSLLRLEEEVNWFSVASQSRKEGKAQRVELWFPEPAGLLERVQAYDQVQVVLRGEPAAGPVPRSPNGPQETSSGQGVQILTTQQAEMILAEDGETLRQVRTQSASTLRTLPSRIGENQWTVLGDGFQIEFGPNGDLSQFWADGNVRVSAESAGKTSRQQSSRSDHLRARFDPRTHTFDQVQQWGQFSYQDPEKEARADRAEYSAAGEEVVLQGNPVVWNPSGRISAQTITLQNAAGELTAAGRVTTTHFPAPSARGPAPEPIHAIAERLQYNLAAERAQYEGKARLWQGTGLLVEADGIELDQREEQLLARGRVYSVFRGSPNPRDPKPAPSTPAANGPAAGSESYAIRSDSLLYQREQQRARYQGGVRMQSSSRILTAGELEIFFQGEEPQAVSAVTLASGQIERAVAIENVIIVEGARKATGDRAEYLPEQGRILLFGKQATIYSPPQGLTQGARLTYLMGDDRILVDGEPGLPAETRGQVQR